MIEKFRTVYALAVNIGICLVFGISFFITRPIRQLTIATKKIAEGDYKERVVNGGTDEVGQLAGNFNRMAAAVEEKMEELLENAKQKEDFMRAPYYAIKVKDNGSGIPEQEIRRIKEAFYMVDKSRSRKQHGAGIGLALSEKIAQVHGGSLEFESDGKSGTSVGLCLECKEVEEAYAEN